MSTTDTIKNIAVTVAGDLLHLSGPTGACLEVAVTDLDELYQGVKDLIGKEKAALAAERAAAPAPAEQPAAAAMPDTAAMQSELEQLRVELAALKAGAGPAATA